MKKNYTFTNWGKFILVLFLYSISLFRLEAQTDIDGIFMSKNLFCVGVVGSYSNFTNYWEGSFHRDNLNMGIVSNRSINVMGNYGINSRLNFIFSIPYVWTQASAGNMQGQQGFQDLSLWLKYALLKTNFAGFNIQGIIAGGYSFPVSNYSPDLLPLSIGLHSRTSSLRGILDIERNNWYFTGSYTLAFRENIHLDRNTYYADRMYYSSEVSMPNVAQINARFGFRNEHWIIDVMYDYMNTLGGFDIPKNGMPFPSNDMEAEKIGLNLKYETPINGLSLVANGYTVFSGKNMGHWRGLSLGTFYIF